MQQLGDVVDVDAAALVEDDRERVCRAGDFRAAGGTITDRPGLRGVRLAVVVLDRGDEPAVRVVEEGLDVGRRCVSRTSPLSSSSTMETVVKLIGPKSRTKFD